jgi:CO/xanthine dehydrogenase FAD-binding subunit
MDWAVSAVAVALTMANGMVSDCRITLGGVAPIPWRVPKAEAALKGKAPNEETLQTVADAALEGALGLKGNAYKIPLTKTLVRRAIMQAAKA